MHFVEKIISGQRKVRQSNKGKQNVYLGLTFPILIQPYQISHPLSKILKSKDVGRKIVSSSCHQRTYAKLYLNVFVQITEQV